MIVNVKMNNRTFERIEQSSNRGQEFFSMVRIKTNENKDIIYSIVIL